MHFDFTISLGSITVFVAILGGVWRVERAFGTVQKQLTWFLIEHEILIQDYCKKNGIDIATLPTRTRRII